MNDNTEERGIFFRTKILEYCSPQLKGISPKKKQKNTFVLNLAVLILNLVTFLKKTDHNFCFQLTQDCV